MASIGLVGSVGTHTNPGTLPVPRNQPVDVGIVTVWHDNTSLYVEYNIEGQKNLDIPDGWELLETRLAVGGIRQVNPANPNQGNFPFYKKHYPPVKGYTYVIDLDEWETEPGEFYIATQAVLGPSKRKESSYGGDTGVSGFTSNWATYFSYTLEGVSEDRRKFNRKAMREIQGKGKKMTSWMDAR